MSVSVFAGVHVDKSNHPLPPLIVELPPNQWLCRLPLDGPPSSINNGGVAQPQCRNSWVTLCLPVSWIPDVFQKFRSPLKTWLALTVEFRTPGLWLYSERGSYLNILHPGTEFWSGASYVQTMLHPQGTPPSPALPCIFFPHLICPAVYPDCSGCTQRTPVLGKQAWSCALSAS